jgi:MFS family permease
MNLPPLQLHTAASRAQVVAYFASCLLAFTCGHMFNYTVILYLQEAAHSDLLSGIGFGLAFGSSLVFGWFTGVLCDRMAPHRIIHAAQLLFLVGLACLWWAQGQTTNEARVIWVLVGALMGGLAWSFFGPARLAALAQLVPLEKLRPATIVFNLQVLVGFGLAPLLIGLVRSRAGWDAVIALAASGYVLSSILLIGLRTRPNLQPTSEQGLAAPSMWSEIRAGFSAVGTDPLLRQLMLTAVLAYSMTGPLQILLPRLARDVLQLTELQRGAFLGLLALTLITGGISALALAKRVHHGAMMVGGIAGGGLLFASLGRIDWAPLSALTLAGIGIAGGMVISLVVSGIQAQAPAALRGRVMGMYSITSQVIPALSGVAAGALVRATGVTVAIQCCGLALACGAVLALWRLKQLRSYRGQH